MDEKCCVFSLFFWKELLFQKNPHFLWVNEKCRVFSSTFSHLRKGNGYFSEINWAPKLRNAEILLVSRQGCYINRFFWRLIDPQFLHPSHSLNNRSQSLIQITDLHFVDLPKGNLQSSKTCQNPQNSIGYTLSNGVKIVRKIFVSSKIPLKNEIFRKILISFGWMKNVVFFHFFWKKVTFSEKSPFPLGERKISFFFLNFFPLAQRKRVFCWN